MAIKAALFLIRPHCPIPSHILRGDRPPRGTWGCDVAELVRRTWHPVAPCLSLPLSSGRIRRTCRTFGPPQWKHIAPPSHLACRTHRGTAVPIAPRSQNLERSHTHRIPPAPPSHLEVRTATPSHLSCTLTHPWRQPSRLEMRAHPARVRLYLRIRPAHAAFPMLHGTRRNRHAAWPTRRRAIMLRVGKRAESEGAGIGGGLPDREGE
jgi:hypothetical protein